MKIRNFITLATVAILTWCGMAACGDTEPEPPKQTTPETPSTPEETPKEDEPVIVTYRLPDREIRAVWVATVTRIDFPASNVEKLQKEEYIKYLDVFEKYNLNAVIFQIRPCSDAFYNSPYEPWSQYITGTQGKDPGYDMLGWLIEETHKRGMEFHAWMNPYRVSKNASSWASTAAANHPAKLHPEWTVTYNGELLYRPACEEVKQLLVDVIDDVITKYDVDGIHFDDYFYPYPASGQTYNDAADYKAFGAGYSNIGDFRRAQVDDVIKRIHDLISVKKPGVVFSIAPFGIWRNRTSDSAGSDSSGLQNYDDLYADVRKWCQEGWIDLIAPQLYNATSNIAMNYSKMLQWWNQNAFKAKLAIGQGVYRFGVPAEGTSYQSADELSRQMDQLRAADNVIGSFLYNASAFLTNKVGWADRLKTYYRYKALIPEIGLGSGAEAPTPVEPTVDGRIISWPGKEGMRYVVYQVAPSSTSITEYNANMIAILTEPEYKATSSGLYAISTINVDNVESELSQPVRVN
ncbi:MAG: family 10 glycosylhydrolase [Muribaculaceae bacterium]|nr:family 10 glycosylhydrolase [Muribaculaceae bacterium]